MTDVTGRSLSDLGLMAPYGLECREGGFHHVLEPELLIAAGEEGGVLRCLKCGESVVLRSLRELE